MSSIIITDIETERRRGPRRSSDVNDHAYLAVLIIVAVLCVGVGFMLGVTASDRTREAVEKVERGTIK